MPDQTKAEIAAERDELRDELDKLRAQLATAGGPAAPYKPFRPHLSEGERQDLLANGVTNSPFTGEQITASSVGVKPASEPARLADKRATAGRAARDRADIVGLDAIEVDDELVPGAPAGQ